MAANLDRADLPGSTVTVRCGCRIDLAGGTLDLWPLGLLHPGAKTVNVALDLTASVRLTPADRGYRVVQAGSVCAAPSPAALLAHPDGLLVGAVAVALELPPFEVELASDSPRGGGLGASSALAVALLVAALEAFDRPRLAAREIAHLARDVETTMMSLPTGIQDHYPALLGGALEIAHRPGGETVRPLRTDLDLLGASLVVAYSGESHFSAGKNWQVLRRRLDGETEVTELFSGIAEIAAAIGPELEAASFSRVGRLMSEEWALRRRLTAGISTPRLEALLAAGLAAGAWGGKACGAGGGGCLALLCPPERRAAVAQRMANAGGRILKTKPAPQPLSGVRS